MKKYKHLFFDLDRTLWDFDKNSKETLHEIYDDFNLHGLGTPEFEEFYNHYLNHNVRLWELYRNEKIQKDFLSVERFYVTLQHFGIENKALSEMISKEYVKRSPLKTNLCPHTHEALSYLSGKYTMHIITNGFEEIQHKKLKTCGLDKYFESVITSEEAGCKKPDKNIFFYSLEKSNSNIPESIMIGDDIAVDILAAKSVGMDQVFINHQKIEHKEDITYEIFSLKELTEIL